MDGLQAALGGQHRHFHAATIRQVIHQAEVAHIAVELEHFAVAKDGVEDIRRVFLSAREIQRFFEPLVDFLLPGGFAAAVFIEDVGILARVPAGAVQAVLFDEVGALAEPGIVFAVVARRLGHIIAQRQEHFVAHDFLVVHFRPLGDGLADERIRVLAIDAEIQIEGLVVDARAGVRHVFVLRADPLGQHGSGALHAVAQAAGHDVRIRALYGAAKHGHGVGIVEVHGAGAIAVDIRGDLHNGVNRAQIAENAAGAARVAHVGVHAILLGDENVVLPYIHIAGQDCGYYAFRTYERFLAVHGRFDLRGVFALGHNALHRALDGRQALRVDVHQADGGVVKRREREQVAHQRAREAKAARADKSNFMGHEKSSLPDILDNSNYIARRT